MFFSLIFWVTKQTKKKWNESTFNMFVTFSHRLVQVVVEDVGDCPGLGLQGLGWECNVLGWGKRKKYILVNSMTLNISANVWTPFQWHL